MLKRPRGRKPCRVTGCGGAARHFAKQLAGTAVPIAEQLAGAAFPFTKPGSTKPVTVAFSGLPTGTYPIHLHSRCNGSQGFHITVLQNLLIAAGGSGGIGVPSAYFGRGLCLIVYASPSLSAVLTTRPI